MQYEIDLGTLHVHLHDANLNTVAEAIALTGALAEQLVLGGIELEIILAEFGDVHQTFDIQIVQ